MFVCLPAAPSSFAIKSNSTNLDRVAAIPFFVTHLCNISLIKFSLSFSLTWTSSGQESSERAVAKPDRFSVNFLSRIRRPATSRVGNIFCSKWEDRKCDDSLMHAVFQLHNFSKAYLVHEVYLFMKIMQTPAHHSSPSSFHKYMHSDTFISWDKTLVNTYLLAPFVVKCFIFAIHDNKQICTFIIKRWCIQTSVYNCNVGKINELHAIRHI